MADNTLYYGDNLDILRRYVADESVDLSHLDQLLNTSTNYAVPHGEHGGEKSAPRVHVFEFLGSPSRDRKGG